MTIKLNHLGIQFEKNQILIGKDPEEEMVSM
jgi:hypothetical protein